MVSAPIASRSAPSRRTVARTLALDFGPSGQLPTEFPLFTAGWNETENGRYLFDEAAAKATMAAYERWGVDLMIDLEHQSLRPEVPPEPNARDARGWCRLELRPDGSLWATSVSWTPDGAARLTEKRQRYVSPAFAVDPETSRITSIINVAIVAIPATHDTPALVAASARGEGMDPELIKQALDALIAGDDAKAAEILKGLVAAAAGAPPEEEPAEEPAPMAEMAAAPTPTPPEELVAAGAILRLAGATSFVAALSEVESFRTSHLTLETERQKLAAERATLEAAERRKICVELVTLGAEFPATVWADDKATTLKPRWLRMDLAELRTHASEQRAARGGKSPPAPRPPATASLGAGGTTATDDGGLDVTTPMGVVSLSAREVAMCAEKKVDPKDYAARKPVKKG